MPYCSVDHLPGGWVEVGVSLDQGSYAVKEGAVMILSASQLPNRSTVTICFKPQILAHSASKSRFDLMYILVIRPYSSKFRSELLVVQPCSSKL